MPSPQVDNDVDVREVRAVHEQCADRTAPPARALGAVAGRSGRGAHSAHYRPSSEIGRALAQAVAAAGATTLVMARRADELAVLLREIGERGGVAHAIAGDLPTDEGIDAVADRVLAAFGAPEILVDNASRSIRRSVANSERRGVSAPADVRADADNVRIES
ncbi:SDR family NAD(P)-dependent oxidoreductase [Nocardia sp. CA-107356]|uniref:SDR family NAD(P)-dependent oxidoreductase n=1 Tax=Nocardia sp. CA-107356 TaxID=3239972 RepID=UPI003D938F1C